LNFIDFSSAISLKYCGGCKPMHLAISYCYDNRSTLERWKLFGYFRPFKSSNHNLYVKMVTRNSFWGR